MPPTVGEQSLLSEGTATATVITVSASAVWCSGNALRIASINIAALHQTWLVPGWVCLWMGKPSRYVTSQLGRLSLQPSVGWLNESFWAE